MNIATSYASAHRWNSEVAETADATETLEVRASTIETELLHQLST